MDQNRIVNRIVDLLKLTGIRDQHTVEELTDHYMTHIEEEIKRGVNSQQAIRETFQEIAHLEIIDLSKKEKRKNHWLFFTLLFFTLSSFFAIRFGVFQKNQHYTGPVKNTTEKILNQQIEPPSGFPISQSLMDISSGFGLRIHPINKQKVKHKGIDIRAKLGTPVLATGDGIVAQSDYGKKSGYFIKIDHNNEYSSKYLHLSEILVECGAKVKKGDIIGKVGNSGLSFKSHLHYEILKSDVHVNPKEYIKP